jgi:hypothetical protein
VESIYLSITRNPAPKGNSVGSAEPIHYVRDLASIATRCQLSLPHLVGRSTELALFVIFHASVCVGFNLKGRPVISTGERTFRSSVRL